MNGNRNKIRSSMVRWVLCLIVTAVTAAANTGCEDALAEFTMGFDCGVNGLTWAECVAGQ